MKQYQYDEFDYQGKRHHCLEMPMKSVTIKQWLARRLGLVDCRYAACADHLEVFCMVHHETIDVPMHPEDARNLRNVIRQLRKEGQIPE